MNARAAPISSPIDSVSSVDAIQAQLRELDINIEPVPLLKDTDKSQWEPYGSLPCCVASKECWEVNYMPQGRDLIADVIQGIRKGLLYPKKMRAYLNGVSLLAADDAVRALVLSEMSSERASAKIINIPNTNTGRFCLQFPDGLRRTEVDTRVTSWIGKGEIEHFHIDGVSSGLWACLGPTSKLRLTYQSKELHPDWYEGCVMAVTTYEEAMFLPAGSIYATVSLSTGWLTGINFHDQYSILGAIPAFLFTLECYKERYVDGDVDVFTKILDDALGSEEWPRQVVEDWWFHKGGRDLLLERRRKGLERAAQAVKNKGASPKALKKET